MLSLLRYSSSSPWLHMASHSHPEVTYITSAPFHCPDQSHTNNMAVKEAGNYSLCFGQTCAVPNLLLLRRREDAGGQPGDSAV